MKPTPREPDDAALAEQDEDSGDDRIIGQALVVSLAVFAAIAVVFAVGVGVLYWMRQEHVVIKDPKPVALPEERDVSKVTVPVVPFTDVTKASGITFVHENGAYGEKLLPETMGSGCAVFDYDGDGDQDILFVNSRRWPWDPRPKPNSPATMALYQNDGRGKFQDVTVDVGLDHSFYGMGVAAADFDSDGDIDLFITAVGKNRLYVNEEGKRFRDATESTGVGGDEATWSTAACWFDYDRDGRLDLFVSNYIQWSRDIDRVQGFKLDGKTRAYGPPASFEGTFCYLYHNEGKGRFRDVTQEAGIQVTNPATGVPMAKALGALPVDVDNDGWIDLIVANDTVQNFLFHNVEGKRFEEVGATHGIAFDENGLATGAMGIDAAYYRNDGTLAVAIGNFANEMTSLFVKEKDLPSFFDASFATGLGPRTRLLLTFGVFFFDYDLDGRLDLFSANGHLEQDISKVIPGQHYRQPAQLFWNAGDDAPAEFIEVLPEQCGPELSQPIVGRGAAYGDFDGDGDLDLVVTENGGPARLFRNDQELDRHYVRVQLRSSGPNRDAIGAQVELHVGSEVCRRIVAPARSYLSQVELPLTFGLGDKTEAGPMVIRWPDGTEQTVEKVAIDRLVVVTQQVGR